MVFYKVGFRDGREVNSKLHNTAVKCLGKAITKESYQDAECPIESFTR